ncbi:hypothetical protein M3196_19895 [Fictibacillus nanhaiensis]|uniref:hypothetical protein n=1 Tax=Fictibacillus nanhaiensis TaxID=742169 RepID=UPI002041D4B0|nr:hypothetical protein [Fictibacillus nanhaiensis]MCM3733914.1 hypothetical protein [Fictibacillus nanhaiensis]
MKEKFSIFWDRLANKVNPIWERMQQNKDKIYYAVIMLFFIVGVIYAIKGYYYHQSIAAVKDGNDLIERIFSPFILAVLRFVLVMLLGIFVAMNLIANPLKRIKVMQFEVEFAELAKVQEKQLNQFHFISSVLRQNDYFIKKFKNSDDIPYELVLRELLMKYEEFFDTELQISLSTQVLEYQEQKDSFLSPEYNRLTNLLMNELDSEILTKIHTRKKMFGETNFMLAARREMAGDYIVLIESKDHIFTDYDKEVLNGIFEYSKMITDSIMLLSVNELDLDENGPLKGIIVKASEEIDDK